MYLQSYLYFRYKDTFLLGAIFFFYSNNTIIIIDINYYTHIYVSKIMGF